MKLNTSAEDFIKALIFELTKGEIIFSETKIQKLAFIILYVKKWEKQDEKYKLKGLEPELPYILPDYKITLTGLFSPSLSKVLCKLSLGGVIEKDDEYVFVPKDIETLRTARLKIAKEHNYLGEKIRKVVKEFGQFSAEKLTNVIDEMVFTHPMVRGMAIGLRFKDFVKLVAKHEPA